MSNRLAVFGRGGWTGSAGLTGCSDGFEAVLPFRFFLWRCLRFCAGLGLGCLCGRIHICLGPDKRVLQLKMGADEVDQRLPKLGVEFLSRSCDSEWRRECLVLIVLQFLGDDVYTDLIIFGWRLWSSGWRDDARRAQAP
jgi:hypothetical protein